MENELNTIDLKIIGIKNGKISFSLFFSLFSAAFYMLVFYKTQNYSNYRALSYAVSFSVLLILDLLMTAAFYFRIRKAGNSDPHRKYFSLKKVCFAVTSLLSIAVLFVSSDWIFGINMYADTNIYKKILLFIQFASVLSAVPFAVDNISKKDKNLSEYVKKKSGRNKKGFSFSSPDEQLFLFSFLYLLSVILLFSPVKLYTSAPGEIEAGISGILVKNITVVVLLAGCSPVFFCVLRGSLKSAVLKITLFIAFCAFFYSFILNISYGALDNYILTNAKVLNKGFLKNIIEISALIGLAFIVSFLADKKKILIRNIFLILLAVGFVQSAVSLIGIRGYDEKKISTVSREGYLPEYNKDLMGYSKEGKNIVVLLLDMFSGGYLPEILEEMPELEDTLSGFTWYPNTLTAGYNTSSSVPGMYAGWSYVPSAINEKEYNGYIVDQIIESYEVLPEILSEYNYKTSYTDPDYYRTPHGNIDELEKRGITAGFNQDYLPYWKSVNTSYDSDFSGAEKKSAAGKNNPETKASRYLLAVSLFKAAPLILKPLVYNEGDWLFIGGGEVRNNAYKFALKSWAFMDLLDEVSNADAEGNTFKYFHNYITHEPFAMSSEGKPVLGYPDPEAGDNIHGRNAYYSAKSAMMAVSDWVKWLKKNNIYDNTKLIIVADHGNDVAENPMMKKNFKVEGLSSEEFNRAQIVLLVKDFNAEGALKTDIRLMSNADIPAIILSSLDEGKEGEISPEYGSVYNGSVFPEDPAPGRSFPADPTRGEPVSRTLRTVKSDSWRWEYITKNRKFEYKWIYDVKDNLFDDKNWTKVE